MRVTNASIGQRAIEHDRSENVFSILIFLIFSSFPKGKRACHLWLKNRLGGRMLGFYRSELHGKSNSAINR